MRLELYFSYYNIEYLESKYNEMRNNYIIQQNSKYKWLGDHALIFKQHTVSTQNYKIIEALYKIYIKHIILNNF